jgi:DNA ligase-1
MLAFKLDEPEQARLPVLVSPKLDGIRCLIVAGVPVSRNMKKIPNKHIYNELKKLKLTGLDGELIVGPPTAEDCYRVTNSGVMSAEGEPDWTYYVFDDFSALRFEDRLKAAAKRVKAAKHSRVKMVPHFACSSAERIDELEAAFLAEGYEGIMGRDINGLYKQGRSGKTDMALWKLKRFVDSEAEILGFQEQMHNANPAKKDALGRTERSGHKANMVPKNTLGALHVRDVHSGVTFDIGTGFDDEERRDFWENKGLYMGAVVKYKSMPIGVKDKPRFPVFLGFRSDL